MIESVHRKTSKIGRIIQIITKAQVTGKTIQTNMIIYNPSKTIVSIVIKGAKYSVEPNDYAEVADSCGAEWIKIHQFLQVVDKIEKTDSVEKKIDVVDAVKELENLSKAEEVKEATEKTETTKRTPKKALK